MRVALAVAFALLAGLAVSTLDLFAPMYPTAFADDVSFGEIDGTETTLDTVKRLIVALPSDPDLITEAHRAAIETAAAAYGDLSVDEQKLLDATSISGKDQTYGRRLESAQWGLLARQPVDSSVSLLDGDYSSYVSSVSSMGKSTSQRARTWTVSKLVVSGGKVTATVRCGTESAFSNMRVGGVDYKASMVEGVPYFTVPLAVNATTTFTIDANAIADSIAYQITVTLPMVTASTAEVSAAKTKASSASAGASSKYVAADAATVVKAANALGTAAAKKGVTAVELKVATQQLDNAIFSAKALSQSSSKKQLTTATGSGSTGTTGTGTSQVTGTSLSQSVPTTGTSTTGTSNTAGTSGSTSSSSASGSSSSAASASTKQASGSGASADKSSGSAAVSLDAADRGGPASGSGADGTDGATVAGVSEITDAITSAREESALLMRVIVGGGVLALALAGMVARTFLFMRAKEIA